MLLGRIPSGRKLKVINFQEENQGGWWIEGYLETYCERLEAFKKDFDEIIFEVVRGGLAYRSGARSL